MKAWNRFVSGETAQSLLEYAIVFGTLGLGALAVMVSIGSTVRLVLSNLTQQLNSLPI